jgi:hypothetical protein
MISVDSQLTFRKNISPPSSGSSKPSKAPTTFTLISCSPYPTLKMEAICSAEASIDFQRTIRRYIPEDITLHNQRRQNLKPNKHQYSLSLSLSVSLSDVVFLERNRILNLSCNRELLIINCK